MSDGPTRLIPLQEAESRTGKSRWWLRQQWMEDKFPRPLTVGHRRTMFVESEVEAWIQERIAERDGRAA